MSISNRLKRAAVIGCSCAMMFSFIPGINRFSFLFFSRFLPSFAYSQQESEPEIEDVEYCFGLAELFRSIFG